MRGETRELKLRAMEFFEANRTIYCPAFPGEGVVFNSKGLSHLFYKGSNKISGRSVKEIVARVELLPRAVELLKAMPFAQEESSSVNQSGRTCHYFAFEAVVQGRRIKVIIRQVGTGKKHFWSVIPAWRRIRGERVNARSDLSRE